MLEPVCLHNPLNEEFEVMSGGVVYVFESKQSRMIQGETARQILKNQNTPLIVVDINPVIPEEVETDPKAKSDEAVDYKSMSYAQLRSIASAKGLFKVGMKGKDLLELLNGQQS